MKVIFAILTILSSTVFAAQLIYECNASVSVQNQSGTISQITCSPSGVPISMSQVPASPGKGISMAYSPTDKLSFKCGVFGAELLFGTNIYADGSLGPSVELLGVDGESGNYLGFSKNIYAYGEKKLVVNWIDFVSTEPGAFAGAAVSCEKQ